ncbi:unnamed protein product [Linum trigynum]|uniref:Uncharacterized protein n=1 Tax=Linum trigynum TaxID=586398 RepID=A0AAV2CIP7_9ROSI
MVEDVYKQGPTAVQKASQLLLPHILPQVAGLLEPRESEAPKGQPPKRSDTRDLSWFEHWRKLLTKRSKTNQNTRRTHQTTPAGGVSKSQHIDGSLEAISHRLDHRTPVSCTQLYGFEDVDLMTFAILYNCAIVVYRLYNERHTAHWLRLYVEEIDGVTPMPSFSPQWSQFGDMLRVDDWDSLYEPQMQLYVILGGHYQADENDESD